jgi:DNA replication protein DnaC
MEHIREILQQAMTPTNTSEVNMDTWSNAEETEKAPQSLCPICKGASYVHPRLPSGKLDFSRTVPCRCTKDRPRRDSLERLLRYSNLGALSHMTLANFIPQGRSQNLLKQEQMRRAFEAARTFAATPKGWLILSGPSGCGKTHLAAAIANECLVQNRPAFFISTPDLLERLRAAFNPESEVRYDEFFDRVRNAPVLILDDFGVQDNTPWAREKLDQLFNYRFNNELPMVIVASTPLNDVEERLRTRLTNPKLCQVYALEENKTMLLEYGWSPAQELQKRMTFDSFDHRRVNLSAEQRQNLEQVYRTALEFARAPSGWLVLMGVNGCGKTHLAAAIANYQYSAAKPALFIVVPEFLDHLRSTFSPESKISYDLFFENVKTTPLLVLDDFGEQSATPWAQEKLYQVINHRYNARRATVITTCASLDEIEIRISSRLVDPQLSTPLNITAPDYRGDRRDGAGQKARPAHPRK